MKFIWRLVLLFLMGFIHHIHYRGDFIYRYQPFWTATDTALNGNRKKYKKPPAKKFYTNAQNTLYKYRTSKKNMPEKRGCFQIDNSLTTNLSLYWKKPSRSERR